MSEDVEELFKESGGLSTTADLRFLSGTSPVTVSVVNDRVRLSIGVSGGEVSADLTGERAAQLGEALLEGSEHVEEGQR